jgi:TRAP-type mannitol/chloroaromatic compound transport system permease large subunit
MILAFSGIARNLINLVGSFDMAPVYIIIFMLLIIIFLGMFMESLSIMMVVVPIYMPMAQILDINLVWFAVLILIAIEVGQISPPFGLGLFVMKGVSPKSTTMGDIYKASVPFIFILFLLMAIVLAVPSIAMWLPDMMKP